MSGTNISIASATWELHYAWLVRTISGCDGPAQGDAPSQTFIKRVSTEDGAFCHCGTGASGRAGEEEMEPADPNASLTKAMMVQSKALTSLVATIATGDPIMHLSSGSTNFPSRGAQGRVKLQQELAQHCGTFFNSLFCALACRMQPARVAEASPQDIAVRGVTASRHVER